MYIVKTKDRFIVVDFNPMKNGKIDPAFAIKWFGSEKQAQGKITLVLGPVKEFSNESPPTRLEIFEVGKSIASSYFMKAKGWVTEKGEWEY